MTPDKLFSICNPLALIGWLILVFAGRMKWAASLVTVRSSNLVFRQRMLRRAALR